LFWRIYEIQVIGHQLLGVATQLMSQGENPFIYLLDDVHLVIHQRAWTLDSRCNCQLFCWHLL